MMVGAAGGIIAVANVVPEVCVTLWELVRAERHDEARVLQHELTPLAQAVTRGYGIPGLKVAMELAGYVGGDVRGPLRPAKPEAREVLRALYDELRGFHDSVAHVLTRTKRMMPPACAAPLSRGVSALTHAVVVAPSRRNGRHRPPSVKQPHPHRSQRSSACASHSAQASIARRYTISGTDSTQARGSVSPTMS